MTTTAHPDRAAAPTLPAALRLGPVHLTVTDVDRSVAWYQEALGLRVHRHDAGAAELGDGEATTLVLVEEPQARRPGRTAGLFHYALLFPSREELARAAIRLSLARTPIQGASDHGTHEAIYLSDPDGNGIELAADRPRDLWPTPEEEFGGGGPRPLDFDALLATIAGEVAGAAGRPRPAHGPPAPARRRHRARARLLPRPRSASRSGGCCRARRSSSAGGYHHHLGFNVWRGEGVPPAPAGIVGLREWTIELPAAADVAAVRERLEAAGVPVEPGERGFLVRDPWDMALRVVEAGA